MNLWLALALGVIAVGTLGTVWWLSRSTDRDAEERAERALAERPDAGVEWLQRLNPQKAADRAEREPGGES